MKRIPNAREVAQALRGVQAALKQSLQGLNQNAAELMAKGNYNGAEALAAKGRELQKFQAEVDALAKRWQVVRRGTAAGKGNTKQEKTPLWAYYQPVLKAIIAMGGEAQRADIAAEVERLMADVLQPADRETMARGQPRWQLMIRRTRKHLVAEGWIEDRRGSLWAITGAGRQAADVPGGPSPPAI